VREPWHCCAAGGTRGDRRFPHRASRDRALLRDLGRCVLGDRPPTSPRRPPGTRPPKWWCAVSAAACAASWAPHPGAKPCSLARSSTKSSSPSTPIVRLVSATGPSSCSATPRRCDPENSPRSTSATSSPSRQAYSWPSDDQRQIKTDLDSSLAWHADNVLRPIWALDAWLKIRPAGAGALFTRVYRWGAVTAERIGPRAVSRLVQARANAAGFDGIPSPDIRCALATPPPPPSTAPRSTGSPPRPAIATSAPSSTTTSDPRRRSRPPPAATSASDSRCVSGPGAKPARSDRPPGSRLSGRSRRDHVDPPRRAAWRRYPAAGCHSAACARLSIEATTSATNDCRCAGAMRSSER
jgi:hypothetical protein